MAETLKAYRELVKPISIQGVRIIAKRRKDFSLDASKVKAIWLNPLLLQ